MFHIFRHISIQSELFIFRLFFIFCIFPLVIILLQIFTNVSNNLVPFRLFILFCLFIFIFFRLFFLLLNFSLFRYIYLFSIFLIFRFLKNHHLGQKAESWSKIEILVKNFHRFCCIYLLPFQLFSYSTALFSSITFSCCFLFIFFSNSNFFHFFFSLEYGICFCD